jgi:hypothetical protein
MRRGAVLLLALALAAGCASSGPPVPPALLAETEAAIHRAEGAGAQQRASELLTRARRAWDEGRLASSRGEGETARRRLDEARAYAEAAEAQANADRLKTEAASLRREADELEMKTRQIREQSRNP